MPYVTDQKKSIRVKRYKIEITELAEKDLENVADYIAFELSNFVAAKNTVKGIRKQINSLVNFPERNELDEDEFLAEIGVRTDYYRNYKIYYIIWGDTIYIVRILHMLVDSRAWLYQTFGIDTN